MLLGVGIVSLALPALLLPRTRTAKEWIGDLTKGSPEQRITAAYALRHCDTDDLELTLRALLRIVGAAEPHLQGIARESARQIAPADIALVVDIFDGLSAEDEVSRQLCEGVLLNRPEEAVELLIEIVGDPSAKARQSAAHLLSRFGSPAVEPLGKLLWDENPSSRLLAAWALGAMGERAQSVLGLLRALARAPTALERRTALQAMGTIDPGHEKTLRLADALLQDEALETRRAALLAFFEGWVTRLDRKRGGANLEARAFLGEAFAADLARLLDDFDAHAANGGQPPR